MTAPFPPTRAAALDRLAAFAPRAGRAYAAGRGTDPGPDAMQPVSMLSPYVRHRLLLEQELVAAAHAAHGPEQAARFTGQVFWRTYWKGWLQARPAAWQAYAAEVRQGLDRLATEEGLRRRFHAATEGETGIDCFDAWARALVADNWLHNHARMWFASIWIFTLRLPWALGAEFFARHLLDGDPASNTLSWRWVAGLHTPGKHYVARAENIRRYTEGRFDPAGALDEDPAPLQEVTPVPGLRPLPAAPPPPRGEVALLIHTEDLLPETLLSAPADAGMTVAAVAALAPLPSSVAHGAAAPVQAFRTAALADAAGRAADAFGRPVATLDPADLPDWAASVGLPIVSLLAPVGPTADALAASGVAITPLIRPWDALSWPHATRGYFQFARGIEAIIRTLGV